MMELQEYIDGIVKERRVDYSQVIQFLEDNAWFGSRPELKDGRVELSYAQQELYRAPLVRYASNRGEKEFVTKQLEQAFPATSRQLSSFFRITRVSKGTRFYIEDFLLYRLKKEIAFMNDAEMSQLVSYAVDEMIKAHGDVFTFFLSWLKSTHKTAYKNEYVMKNRYETNYKNQAYDIDEYTELMYYLYNEEYIRENDMYKKAAESKNYADTWLFLAIHFICPLRFTDLVRIPHPELTDTPETVLMQIKKGDFSDADARKTLYSVTFRLCMLQLKPNKTSSHSNISAIKFHVPSSAEVHIGTLLALCEAHRQIIGIPDRQPLIRKIADYDRISRYMGDEIGYLFLDSNFRSRSANKSYLQAVYMLTDDVLGDESLLSESYVLTALARSHKGSYADFAQTTAVYLKDAKFNGLTPEYVAKELFERGVLSFIPSMLLKMVTDGEYNKLSPSKQTELIYTLDMSPGEVEHTVSVLYEGQKRAEYVVQELFTHTTANESGILEILHRIGNGSAFAKQPECLCLLSAVKKFCPFDDRKQCVGCLYEIGTKSTLFLLLDEYKRMVSLYKKIEEEPEKSKYRNMIRQVVIPQLDEILFCLKEQYGQKVFAEYETMIKEYMNE